MCRIQLLTMISFTQKTKRKTSLRETNARSNDQKKKFGRNSEPMRTFQLSYTIALNILFGTLSMCFYCDCLELVRLVWCNDSVAMISTLVRVFHRLLTYFYEKYKHCYGLFFVVVVLVVNKWHTIKTKSLSVWLCWHSLITECFSFDSILVSILCCQMVRQHQSPSTTSSTWTM